jgi:hypothetical protein
MGNSAPENLCREISPYLHGKWVCLDNPVIGQCLDVRREVLAAAFARDDEVVK